MTIKADLLKSLQRLVDESDIQRIASEIDDAVDSKNWSRFRSYFDAELTIALPSLNAAVQKVTADEFVKDIAAYNFAEKKSYHGRQSAVAIVDGESAVLRGHMYGWNQLEGYTPDMFEIWGQYEYRFRRTAQGWKVIALKHVKFHVRGNLKVAAVRSPST